MAMGKLQLGYYQKASSCPCTIDKIYEFELFRWCKCFVWNFLVTFKAIERLIEHTGRSKGDPEQILCLFFLLLVHFLSTNSHAEPPYFGKEPRKRTAEIMSFHKKICTQVGSRKYLETVEINRLIIKFLVFHPLSHQWQKLRKFNWSVSWNTEHVHPMWLVICAQVRSMHGLGGRACHLWLGKVKGGFTFMGAWYLWWHP